jgi:simple sugar transport system permease protein
MNTILHNFFIRNSRLQNKDAALLMLASLAAPAAGIAVIAILLFCWSKAPSAALVSFLTGSFRSPYYLGILLNTASLFMTAGTGAALAIKSGQLNLGGEGQIYAGGFVTAIVLNKLVPAQTTSITILAPAMCAAFVCAICTGTAMTVLCGALKERRGANELLTTFLLSAAVIPLIDSAVSGKFRTTEGNLLATPFIADKLRFAKLLPPSPFNASFFAAVLICMAAGLFVYRTAAGRRLQIWGKAPEFARYCGFIHQTNTYGVLAVSGAFHGLTGFFAVCGTYYTCHAGFYAGIGWNALSCALISHGNPAMLVPVSLLLSWIFTSADRVALTENFGFDISSLVQGIVLVSISFSAAVSALRARSNEKKQRTQTGGEQP